MICLYTLRASSFPKSHCTVFSALQPMPFGFPVVQFDMYTAEDWGFNKYDILGQCGLSHIQGLRAVCETKSG